MEAHIVSARAARRKRAAPLLPTRVCDIVVVGQLGRHSTHGLGSTDVDGESFAIGRSHRGIIETYGVRDASLECKARRKQPIVGGEGLLVPGMLSMIRNVRAVS